MHLFLLFEVIVNLCVLKDAMDTRKNRERLFVLQINFSFISKIKLRISTNMVLWILFVFYL